MSDIFKSSIKPRKRTFGDKVFDNIGWVMLGLFLVFIVCGSVIAAFIVSHAHEIAHDAGSIARSAADGFNSKPSH